MEKITYKELARRVGDCVLNNTIHGTAQEHYEFDLYSGDDCYCIKHEDRKDCTDECDEYEAKDIYQEYIISQNSAEYLARNTDEIIFYCESLDIYLWGITHFGTSWDGVYTLIKK